jgi:hypothetical protein
MVPGHPDPPPPPPPEIDAALSRHPFSVAVMLPDPSAVNATRMKGQYPVPAE